jgi:mannose-6-phosphate isomerase
VRRISGVAHHYAWGDPNAIPDLLGLPADGRPWAEWWLGTHPGGPARIEGDGPLEAESGPLPYLLKLLAAGSTLSLQTHPTAAQAEAGFAREEAAGIPRSAPERVYKDPRPKPEMLCALTRFDALCGFRDPWATTALLRRIGADHLAARLDREGLAATISSLYRRELDLTSVLQACKEASDTEARLVNALSAKYPDDPSVVVTLFLQRVVLAPGDAIYLGPGNLHAYLHGVGVEVMGASDNVVRGGLTNKHVDVDELLDVLDPTPLAQPIVLPRQPAPGQWCYDTPPSAADSGSSGDRPPFRLWRLEVDVAIDHTATSRELLLCTGGDVGALAAGQAAYLAPGETVRLEGGGTLFRVEEAGP